ncbi:DUF6928 family protein [Streptomyces sp. NPDC056930]|uniref:DUF6928 family protein n=1 Tax=Streptomyces sp. NPDC056930 TaxID=3345967 RepID=UPI00362AFB8B
MRGVSLERSFWSSYGAPGFPSYTAVRFDRAKADLWLKKTALLFISDEGTLSALRTAAAAVMGAGSVADPARAADLITQWYPGERLESIQSQSLGSVLCPRVGTVHAGRFDGIDVICDQQLMVARPSLLTGWVRYAAEGRRMVLHLMHSAVDRCAFAIWQGGELERSLSLSPSNGVVGNIGEPLPFEAPHWRGSPPVTPAFDGAERHPLPSFQPQRTSAPCFSGVLSGGPGRPL